MKESVRLVVENFGPIKQADILFDKYTVLIGQQGTGKSTIAKLYSMFTWLEKGLIRRTLSKKQMTQYARFQKNYCAYHRLDSYFKEQSVIRFDGLHYNFCYENGKLHITENDNELSFNIAKVMYVPAERNFLSTMDIITNSRNLPDTLKTFLDEFENAKAGLKVGYHLPFGDTSYEYDALNKISWIKGTDYKIRLSAASSGYQSVLPLLLVTKFLADMVQNNANKKDLDLPERKQIEKEVNKVMNDPSISEEVKFATLRIISSRFKYSRFVNIVEEMEQNLYPESQMKVLFELLRYANLLDSNRLLLTTHSPYIVNYLTLAAKAFLLQEKIGTQELLNEKIETIVPAQCRVNPDRLRIYELDNGTVNLVNHYEGVPSDENFLNMQLGYTNELFDALLEIEEEFDTKN